MEKILYLQNDQPFTCPVCGRRTLRGNEYYSLDNEADTADGYEYVTEEECPEHGVFLTVEDKEFTDNNFSLEGI